MNLRRGEKTTADLSECEKEPEKTVNTEEEFDPNDPKEAWRFEEFPATTADEGWTELRRRGIVK